MPPKYLIKLLIERYPNCQQLIPIFEPDGYFREVENSWTINGVAHLIKNIKINKNKTVVIQIWVLNNSERFLWIEKQYYHGSKIVIFIKKK
jgi:hypothetical protein